MGRQRPDATCVPWELQIPRDLAHRIAKRLGVEEGRVTYGSRSALVVGLLETWEAERTLEDQRQLDRQKDV